VYLVVIEIAVVLLDVRQIDFIDERREELT